MNTNLSEQKIPSFFFEDIDGESHISRFVRTNYYDLTIDENGLERETKNLSPEKLFRIRRDVEDFNFERIGFRHLENGGVVHLLSAMSPEVLKFIHFRGSAEKLVLVRIQENDPLDDGEWDFLIELLCRASAETGRFLIPLSKGTLLISSKDDVYFLEAILWAIYKMSRYFAKVDFEEFQKIKVLEFPKNYNFDFRKK